jgi:hypothetical protein
MYSRAQTYWLKHGSAGVIPLALLVLLHLGFAHQGHDLAPSHASAAAPHTFHTQVERFHEVDDQDHPLCPVPSLAHKDDGDSTASVADLCGTIFIALSPSSSVWAPTTASDFPRPPGPDRQAILQRFTL